MAIRLLNTKSLVLKSFLEDQAPQYAILSHTWFNEGEVSFQDMLAISRDKNHPATQTLGYKKVLETCKQSHLDRIEYCWIDTCCIDKSSSSELSEAINSMFKWYQKAKICYVLLSDMTAAGDITTQLPNSRWFTRGWCLQELLAPSSVEFYDKDWILVGSKLSLKSIISRITNIPTSILSESSLIGTTSVAARMSWAAERQTTRREDTAYCLLGIFNVNMPLLYGEGDKAFLRLQEEIIHRNNDRSIFAFRHVSPREEERDLESSTKLYLNLFAISPRDFLGWSNSGPMEPGAYGTEAFALTNKGVHFRTVQMMVDIKRGLYVLPLNYGDNSSKGKMLLRKIGPALYSRYEDLSERTQKRRNATNEGSYSIIEEEAYVLSSITPSLQLWLGHIDLYAIHLGSRTHHIFKAIQAIQRAPSSNRWDASRMLFLRYGERSMKGFWKIFPSLAQPLAGPGHRTVLSSDEHFFLVSGVETNTNREARAWVRLYTSREWRHLEARFGIITNLDDVVDHKGLALLKARIVTPSMIIAATIELCPGQPIFNLNLDFEVNRRAQAEDSFPNDATS